MKLLFKKGSFIIVKEDLADTLPKEQNEIIQLCGTIAHQSQKTSRKTPEEFIKMLWQVRHYSVFEHSWFTFFIPFTLQYPKDLKLNLLEANHLFCLTERKNGVIVSGNARMFIEAYLRYPNHITATLLYFLHQRNPTLFPQIVKEELVLPPLFTFNPKLITRKEVLIHKAMTVIFQHISRGFTHETVRSRPGSNMIVGYTQRSTRYVDPLKKNSFNFILPYRKGLLNQIFIRKVYRFTLDDILYFFSDLYQALIRRGLKPEEARQWLPIGIETEIAQTMNYLEWYHWFVIRTQRAAHPEIRYVACNLLKKIQKETSVFDGFKFHFDKNGICYTKFTPPKDTNMYLI